MIFNDLNEVVNDINSKILSYIIDNEWFDMNELISILKNYLYEIRIINEIDKFSVTQPISDFCLLIEITKQNIDKKFTFDINQETRKLKIRKIIKRK